MIYFVEVCNYSKKDCERVFLLNPSFSKEEIRHQMQKEMIDETVIQEMEEKGIFIKVDITFKVIEKIQVFWHEWKEDGTPAVSHGREFIKRDGIGYKITFDKEGNMSWEYCFSTWRKIMNRIKSL